MSRVGALLDVAAIVAIALGAGLIVWNDVAARAITRRRGVSRSRARRAARALCLMLGLGVAPSAFMHSR